MKNSYTRPVWFVWRVTTQISLASDAPPAASFRLFPNIFHGSGVPHYGKARVKVTLRDKTQMKGSISQIEDSSFSITDKKAGGTKSISYADVERIQGAGLSKGAKIAIVVGVGVAAVVAFGIALRIHLSHQ